MNPLEAMLNLVDAATATYISDTFANAAATIEPTFRTLLILSFILYGLAIWRGAIKSSAIEFVKRVVVIGIVYGMVFSWAIYNQYIVNFLTNGPDALAASMAGVTKGSIANTISDTQGLCFDAMMNAFAGDGYVMKYLIGALIFVASTVVVVYVGFLMIVPKIALSILVALGPLAFLMLLFQGTRRMFDAWLQQCINFFLYIVFTVMLLTLLGGIFNTAVSIIPSRPDEITLGTIVPLVIVCFVLYLVLKQVPGISSAIAGGIQVTTLGAEGAPAEFFKGMYHRWSRRGGGGSRSTSRINKIFK